MSSHESEGTDFVCHLALGFSVFGCHKRTCPACPSVARFLSIVFPIRGTAPKLLCPERPCEGVRGGLGEQIIPQPRTAVAGACCCEENAEGIDVEKYAPHSVDRRLIAGLI